MVMRAVAAANGRLVKKYGKSRGMEKQKGKGLENLVVGLNKRLRGMGIECEEFHVGEVHQILGRAEEKGSQS